ncbi:uncharacterized protein A1O5_08781 [Cladophialophora psammophila CBS 110553]|uniref:Hydrophobin n=1 Tax=Cladophialophora psammophila CBS 110553 TaxID=1182543 RepID=W9WU34_9EURO|nr:uncharacterized protein A1O5_08781 [Cladophialophora psammophila CBS 110553]EXJ68166.1 hypothetical protein A1O5_08781 [Cladophialophora psammophila CBS 110553]
MRLAPVYVLAATFSALPVLAQRGRGGGGGGFDHGGGNTPSTFITRVSAAPPPAAATTAASTGNTGSTSTGGNTGSVDASLIPPFGITPGIKATDGTANCVGDNGVDIPCNCPPDLNTFVSAVETSVAGGAAFPAGNSAADQLTRLQTCIVTLQNFRGGAGSGVGCPIVATTWKELQAQLQSEAK